MFRHQERITLSEWRFKHERCTKEQDIEYPPSKKSFLPPVLEPAGCYREIDGHYDGWNEQPTETCEKQKTQKGIQPKT
jgi:hypothetical protein